MSSRILVFKFGGASVKDSSAVRNVASILRRYEGKNILVILSAMGKTTNALEGVHQSYTLSNTKEALERISESKNYHYQILNDLFSPEHPIFSTIDNLFANLVLELDLAPEPLFDKSYDRIVSYGERIATEILNAFLVESNIPSKLVSAFDYVISDNTYRDAYINWDLTVKKIDASSKEWFKTPSVILTQGFIGLSEEGCPITLGREGSDFSASIFAFALNAKEVTIWKDVPGIMNADPKLIPSACPIEHMSYREAVELAYYGATVIHPKTIKPLENKNTPLRVKSFLNPDGKGTLIDKTRTDDAKVSSFIFKFNQVLISVLPHDFSFINERNLSEIFSLFSRNNIRINIMQNSAISFSVCFDHEPTKLSILIKDLQKNFKVRYNERVDLITIRNYTENSADEFIKGRKVFLEQKSRSTWQLIVGKV